MPDGKAQGRRVCLMCGAEARSFTGEHVFPVWLREFFPIDQQRRPHNRFYPDAVLRDPGTKQIRQVCEACNNQWMSGLQTRAKPTFQRLHEGPIYSEKPRVFTMSADEAHTLTLWAIMTTMVIELLDVHSNSITAEARAKFARDRSFSPDWRVWFAQSCMGAERGFTHKRQLLPHNLEAMNVPRFLAGRPIDWQATTFIAGRAIFVTTSGIAIPPHVEVWMRQQGFAELSQASREVSNGKCVCADNRLRDLNQTIMKAVSQHQYPGRAITIFKPTFGGPMQPVR